MTEQELMDQLKAGVRRIGRKLRGEDDWKPAALIIGPNDTEIIAGIDPNFLQDSKSKQRLIAMLAALIQQHHASLLGLVVPVWVKEISSADTAAEARMNKYGVSAEPDKQECVFIVAFGRERAHCTWTYITRVPKRRPKLSAWDVGKMNDSRFLHEITRALQSLLN